MNQDRKKRKNIILITGASSGMGREFARQLDAGLDSVEEFWLIARRRTQLEELAGQLKHRARILQIGRAPNVCCALCICHRLL